MWFPAGKLLIQAVQQTGLTGNMILDRHAIRPALDNIEVAVEGLVRTYQRPYSVFDQDKSPNAHEAHHCEDYCMTRYGDGSEILLLDDQSR